MAFAPACRLTELEDSKPLKVHLDGSDLAVVKVGDEVFALDDECSHAAVSLAEGDVENCQIECWMHGSAFDLRTGKPSGPPATDPVATYAVKVVGDEVHVDVDDQTNDA